MEENNRANVSEEIIKNDDSDDETKCGFGSWKPEWLQRFATPVWYMIISNILGILQGAFGMYFVGVMSTIEKRFGFSSKITGLIIIADNFSPIIFSSITGYYASHVHRPRLIAFGMFIVVIACYMNALPFFFYGASYHLLFDSSNNKRQKYEFCESHSDRDKSCAELSSKSNTIPALIIFFVSNFLNGVGHNAFYTAGFTYLDDNVEKGRSPLFLGLTYAIRLLGPQLGYFLAGFSLKFYENPFCRFFFQYINA
jgi:MFS family permease